MYINYINGYKEEKDLFIKEMENYAEKHWVPIMDRLAIDALIGLLRIQKPERILEIGSAIGYSAIRMAKGLPNVSVVTVERDSERYKKAVDYIDRGELTDRIQIIEADALDLDMSQLGKESFNAIFIDAAKGQYMRFFEKYAAVLAPGGVIYCDNMFMNGMVLQEDLDIPRRSRTMVRNIKEFTRWVMEHPDYEAVLLPIGDGMLIATKK
ncbi:O-methyltransferase [Sporosarcina sp. CAU 1771]